MLRADVWAAVAAAAFMGQAQAQCLAPLMTPDNAVAVSPFGVDRSGQPGASAGWHLGIDLQKSENTAAGGGKTSPLYAPDNATVIAVPNAGSAGNMMIFKRGDGSQIEFLHMDRFATKFQSARGVPVQRGEYVGELGGTPSYPKHLHLQMKIPTRSALDYRDRMYASGPGAKSKSNTPFSADKLASGYQPSSGMVYVDPQYWLNRQYQWVGGMSKYTAQGFRMASGNKTFSPMCTAGGDASTLAQQQAIDAMGGQNPANMTPAQLDAKGFKDGDRIGVIDAPSFSSYADLSERDVVATEAGRRLTDAGWEQQLAASHARALTIEIARIRAANLWIDQRIEEKQQRVEALYAGLLALRAKRLMTFNTMVR